MALDEPKTCPRRSVSVTDNHLRINKNIQKNPLDTDP